MSRLISMKMKSSFFTLLSIFAISFGFSTASDARPRWGKSHGHHHHHEPSYRGHHGGYHGGHHGSYGRPHYGPPRLLHTREISRRYVYRKGLNRFGRPATFQVPIVTYLEYYSNGTTRTYTRSH